MFSTKTHTWSDFEAVLYSKLARNHGATWILRSMSVVSV